MSVDRERLEEFLEAVADKYTVGELASLLEDEGLIDIWAFIAMFEEEIIEAKNILEI